ncbi:MAG TPA: PIN domain-containing protein [Phycisphaerae bacterium]|nr:PIN domain-containing protein [Phycisphaerae bacterium]
MKTYFADTSFLIALSSPTDGLHVRAVDNAKRPLRLVTSQWVPAEFLAAFSGTADRVRAGEVAAGLGQKKDGTVVPASEEWFLRGLALYRSRPDKEWSLVDCISFEIMRELGIQEALTGDRHFEQAGFVALLKQG